MPIAEFAIKINNTASVRALNIYNKKTLMSK